MVVRVVTMYKASDGCAYDSKEQAEQAERFKLVNDYVNSVVERTGLLAREELVMFILDNTKQLNELTFECLKETQA